MNKSSSSNVLFDGGRREVFSRKDAVMIQRMMAARSIRSNTNLAIDTNVLPSTSGGIQIYPPTFARPATSATGGRSRQPATNTLPSPTKWSMRSPIATSSKHPSIFSPESSATNSPVNARPSTSACSKRDSDDAVMSVSSQAASSRASFDSNEEATAARAHGLSTEGETLVKSLAGRAMTASGNLRKMQVNIKKKYAKQGASSIKFDDNFFMPKRAIQRPDGATLTEVYQSKLQDTWGRIIKAQYVEDELDKERKKREKLQADLEYGVKVKADLAENHRRSAASKGQDEHLARTENESSKKSDDVQKRRKEDAVNRQKQFISNALEDIETKRKKREALFNDEMRASQMMISKAKWLIEQEEQKQQAKKGHEKMLNERLYQENQESLARKEREKLTRFAEDKRIFRQAEEAFQAQQRRREDDLKCLLGKAVDGPAHHVVRQLVAENRRKEEDFYSTLEKTENGLNKQLLGSETANLARMGAKFKDLIKDWDAMNKIHADERRAEEVRIQKLGEYNLKKNAEMNKEDELKRDRKRQAALKYQHELDVQLKQTQQRSLDALTKTMSDREISLNRDLIAKAGVRLA